MSGGEQQMLAIGRAMMGKPKILLLDEPSMGISPVLTERIYETIARDQPGGHDDPAGRAERELRARGLQARLRAGDRQGGDVRQLGRAADQPRSPEGVPGDMTLSSALIGAKALWLPLPLARLHDRGLLPVRAQGLRREAGPGDRALILTVVGAIIWLIWPAKPESKWKTIGPFGREKDGRQGSSRLAGGLRRGVARDARSSGAGSAPPRGWSQRSRGLGRLGLGEAQQEVGWSALAEAARRHRGEHEQPGGDRTPPSRRRTVGLLARARIGPRDGVRQRVAQLDPGRAGDPAFALRMMALRLAMSRIRTDRA